MNITYDMERLPQYTIIIIKVTAASRRRPPSPPAPLRAGAREPTRQGYIVFLIMLLTTYYLIINIFYIYTLSIIILYTPRVFYCRSVWLWRSVLSDYPARDKA